MPRRTRHDGLIMEALLHTLRLLTPVAQGVCALLLLIYLFSGIRFVAPQQTALVERLGRLLPDPHGPGLLLTWPAPLDRVILVETGTEHTLTLDRWAARGPRIEKNFETKEITAAEVNAFMNQEGGHMPLPEEIAIAGNSLDPVTDGYSLTGDWNIVQGRFVLRYRVADAAAFHLAGPAALPALEAAAYQAVTAVLSRVPIDRVLTDDREKISLAIADRIRPTARALGVEPTAFELREIAPPRQVVAAFEDVVNARLFARTLLENAEEYRSQQLTLTGGTATTIRRRAEAWGAQLVAAATGESAAFERIRAEYARAPELITTRLYTETLATVMKAATSATLLPSGATPPAIILEPGPDNTR